MSNVINVRINLNILTEDLKFRCLKILMITHLTRLIKMTIFKVILVWNQAFRFKLTLINLGGP